MTSPLIAKLDRRDRLDASERSALDDLPGSPRRVHAGVELVREHERPSASLLVLDGFCARVSLLQSGGRQITQIGVAGDFLDLHGFLMKQMDHSVVALTGVVVAEIPHDRLRRLTEDYPHLLRLFWLDTLIDAATHRQWILGLGRRTARARLAHLICELQLRLETAGRGQGDSVALPLNQATLGDVLGLSNVHVSRVLKEMREMDLARWSDGVVTVLDRPGLWREAEFDPDYLRLERAPV